LARLLPNVLAVARAKGSVIYCQEILGAAFSLFKEKRARRSVSIFALVDASPRKKIAEPTKKSPSAVFVVPFNARATRRLGRLTVGRLYSFRRNRNGPPLHTPGPLSRPIDVTKITIDRANSRRSFHFLRRGEILRRRSVKISPKYWDRDDEK
jgi:hypothetical protein